MSRNLLSLLSLLLSFSVCLSILAVPSSAQAETPTVYVDFSSVSGHPVGETFPVNVGVVDVDVLFSWEFQIYYDSGILNASSWTVGSAFNTSNVYMFAQSWTDNYNATDGLIDLVFTFEGQGVFSGGSAILATVYFTVESSGAAPLQLQNTMLLDNSTPFPQQIPNTAKDATVYTGTIPGDLNGDGRVSLQDLVILANAYGSTPGDANWNANADINGDGRVSLQDLVILALQYGKSK